MVMEKGKSFHHYDWRNVSWETKGRILWQLLQAVNVVQSKWWMHRDITAANLLIIEEDPPRACLCDFGKVCKTMTATETHVAAEVYLPPEIVMGPNNEYGAEIDIWLLGK